MPDRAIEVVHVGAACRDIAADDPRGWRLGGGVTYAALATARLGLRTAAVVGVDARRRGRARSSTRSAPRAWTCSSSTSTRDRSSTTSETPTGRVQTALARRAAAAGRARPGLVAGGRRAGRSCRSPARSATTGWRRSPRRHRRRSAGRASCATSCRGERVTRRAPTPSALVARADLVGVSRDDVDGGDEPARPDRMLRPGARLLVTHGQRGRPARHRRPADGGPLEVWRYLPTATDREVDPTGAGDTFLGRPARGDHPAVHPRAVAAATAPTCASRPPPDRWPSRPSGSTASRTRPRSWSDGPGSGSVGRSCRARRARSGSLDPATMAGRRRTSPADPPQQASAPSSEVGLERRLGHAQPTASVDGGAARVGRARARRPGRRAGARAAWPARSRRRSRSDPGRPRSPTRRPPPRDSAPAGGAGAPGRRRPAGVPRRRRTPRSGASATDRVAIGGACRRSPGGPRAPTTARRVGPGRRRADGDRLLPRRLRDAPPSLVEDLVEAGERLVRPSRPDERAGQPGDVPERRVSGVPRASCSPASSRAMSRASERTSSSLWRTTAASGWAGPPRRNPRKRPGISQPSTSSCRTSPSSVRSAVCSRASSIRCRNTRRTTGSRSRWPSWIGAARRASR